ncbi:MAG: beta-ketoacyl synthase N-terminal-like domain-containing protein [Desulfatibacillaceae bacterium]
MKAFITGLGVVCPAGRDSRGLGGALRGNERAIRPVTVFTPKTLAPLPVGEVAAAPEHGDLPRCHALAVDAAQQAMAGAGGGPPDAVVVGVTTGGILTTEELLLEGNREPEKYRWHTPGSVAEEVAAATGCAGPVLAVSTACASGTAVLAVALSMARLGLARRVLAVGADSLCRLTYYGFHLLQLIDPTGSRPFCADRAGMNVAEGAGAVVIDAAGTAPDNALARLAGAGLSCDAHHVTAPHPEGRGAAAAIRDALADAGIDASTLDYVNLHGTGTPDNDAAEAAALRTVLGDNQPPASSLKGMLGHSLAAAGAVEAVASTLCIREGMIPGNTGCPEPDPAMGLTVAPQPVDVPLLAVLSNSFGFGGNNAAAVFTSPDAETGPGLVRGAPGFTIRSAACLTGAGRTADTLERFADGGTCAGVLPTDQVVADLDPRYTRRQKRLPCIAMALAAEAVEAAGLDSPPRSVYFGTGLGAQSETHSFLARLFKSNEKFASPTDFVGSLHNSPASQVALMLGAPDANVTATGTDDSFEQALFCARLLVRPEEPLLCLAAEEAHAEFTPLIDMSAQEDAPADGGAAFVLEPVDSPEDADIIPLYLGHAPDGEVDAAVNGMIEATGGPEFFAQNVGAVFAGLPGACRNTARQRLDALVARTGHTGPVVDYRDLLGQFGAASAAACAAAWELCADGAIPAALAGGDAFDLAGRGVLLVGLGWKLSAVLVRRRA